MHNILYINPLLEEITFYVFKNEEIFIENLAININTAATFPKKIVDLVDLYNIQEIWCITGPGPFTLMRIITLAINSLKYTKNIILKSCNFFDIVNHEYIPIIEANSKEYIIKRNNEINIVEKESLEKWKYIGIISEKISTEGIKYIQYEEDINFIKNFFSKKLWEIRIYPIYFKPPHITWSKN